MATMTSRKIWDSQFPAQFFPLLVLEENL